MNKRILTICLALALCLSLIPAAAFAEAPLYTYQEIKTGIKATNISMMDNGFGSFRTANEFDMLVSKGVISPTGNVFLTRTPGENDQLENASDASKHYAGTGSIIIDLLPFYDGPAETVTGQDFDFNLYGTDGKLITTAKRIIASYEKMSAEDIVCSMTAYFGRDGYLTVFANLGGIDVYAYIIDPQTQKVVLKQWCYEDTPRAGGESWGVATVNDGLIAYHHSNHIVTDAGFDEQVFLAAGWMDINGNHKVSIDTEKYNNWWNFASGLAMVYSPTGFYGYVDKTGKEVVPCIYSEASMFKDGYAYVADDAGHVGYIDTTGKTVIPFDYEYAFGYGDGLFTVGHAGQYDNYYGMVDVNNNVVVPTQGYTDISVAKDGIAYAIKDGEIVILKFAEAAPADPNDVATIFKDVKDTDWFKPYVQVAYDNNIVGGKKDKAGDAIYDPNGKLTHGEIMVMVANLHAAQKDESVPRVSGGHWASSYRDYCKAEGIIDARFDEGLDAPVTRAEMAYYFANALSDSSYKETKDITFTDMPENGYDAYILKLAKADMVTGYEDKVNGGFTFRPGNNVTRAEAAVFIKSLLDAMSAGTVSSR
ncbi:MAG: WG repeat-containing protein [Clostridia bacterium]|nr:WG repeat-containing protein [Clostridia bacterium]